MAGRYLKRLLLLNKSSSSSSSSAAAFSSWRPGNHLVRLLGTTTTTTTRYISTMGSCSLNDYEGKQAAVAAEKPSFSLDFLNTYSQYSSLDEDLLNEKLPVLLRALRNRGWSLLHRYCCSEGEIVDIKVALENELVAMCVWFLYIDVHPFVKEGVIWGLKDICFRTSEGVTHALTDVCIDDEADMCLDEETANALVVDALCSKNEEVLRQVCSILGFIATCRRYQTVNFGNTIQEKLIQLSRSYDSHSPVLAHILFAISRISMFSKGMREKMIEAEFSDGLLRRILSSGHYDFSLEAEAYYTVYTIARGHCNDELWKYLMGHLMPAVIDRCIVSDVNVMRAGAHVISTFIAQASPCCIKELIDLGVLKTLIRLLTSEDATVKGYCFKAVETILSIGDADPSKNEYAKMIDDLTTDSQVFYVNNPLKYKDLADIEPAWRRELFSW